MEDLNKWMEEFNEKMIQQNENLLDIINHEYSQYKLRDLSELDLSEKVA